MGRTIRTVYALAALALVAGLASAGPVQLPSGNDPLEISLFDATCLYHEEGGELVPRSPDEMTVAVGDLLRGILYVDAISYQDEVGNTLTAYNPGRDGFELTGVYHGLEVKSVTVQTSPFGTTDAYIYYVPTEDQTVTPPSDPDGIHDEDGEMIPGSGGRVTLYTDTSPDFTWGNHPDYPVSPADWVEGPDYATEKRLDFPGAGAIDLLGGSELGGDVELLVDGTFLPLERFGLCSDPEVVLMAQVSFIPPSALNPHGAGFGWATGFVNSIRDGEGGLANAADLYTLDSPGGTVVPSGAALRIMGDSGEDTGGDFHLFMNIQWGGFREERVYGTDWQFSSNDPVRFVNSPEPATALLFGLPLAALARRVRRRRRG
ncbi:MAG: hypothetical protein ACLF0G_11055 [Candidatus Brocadiia bacterium]